MPSRRELSGNAYEFETLAVTDSAKGFTAGTYGTTVEHMRAYVTAEGGLVRYRYDGSDPTATVGHLLWNGDSILIEGSTNVRNFRAIRAGDVSGSLSVTFEGVYG